MSLRTFIRRILGRQAPPRLGVPDQSTDDWRPGDLGECINDGPWLFCAAPGVLIPADGPKKGELVRVTGVAVIHGYVGLGLEGRANWWHAASFRKLEPKQDEACDREFATRLRQCQPKAPTPARVDA